MTTLIVWEHGANLGHLTRLMAVAQALRLAGRPIMFALPDTPNVAYAHQHLRAAGLQWLRIPSFEKYLPPRPTAAMSAHEMVAGLPANHADVLLRIGFGHMPGAVNCVQNWLRVFEQARPQAVLVDASPMALYAAKAAGLHVTVLGHGFELPPLNQPRPCFMPSNDRAVARANVAEAALPGMLSALAQRLGAAGRAAPVSIEALYGRRCGALCTWPELDHFDRNPDGCRYLGPIWQSPPDATVLTWPKKAGAKVLCYLNLHDNRFEALWRALVERGANVLVLSPGGAPHACESARRWGVSVANRPVDLENLLPASDAVISHGGMGMTGMALQAGKPLMLLPDQTEQRILAQRLSRQQLAVVGDTLRGAQAIEAQLDLLLASPLTKVAATEMAAKYSAFSPDQAVQAVVAQLYGGRKIAVAT